MKLYTSREDNALIINLPNRINSSNSYEFEEFLNTEISSSEKVVLMDCTALDYISSAGLRSILITAKTLWLRDGKFELCTLSPHIRDIMAVVGIDKIIPIHASRADMLASLRS